MLCCLKSTINCVGSGSLGRNSSSGQCYSYLWLPLWSYYVFCSLWQPLLPLVYVRMARFLPSLLPPAWSTQAGHQVSQKIPWDLPLPASYLLVLLETLPVSSNTPISWNRYSINRQMGKSGVHHVIQIQTQPKSWVWDCSAKVWGHTKAGHHLPGTWRTLWWSRVQGNEVSRVYQTKTDQFLAVWNGDSTHEQRYHSGAQEKCFPLQPHK